MTLRIFICYRRRDSEPTAGRLSDYLAEKLGSDAEVFIDVESMPLGKSYLTEIRRKVGNCDVLLAIIGDEWTTATHKSGRRRLDLENDSVRVEISTAINKGIPIIPILVDGAVIPQEDELPSDIAELHYMSGIELRNSSFRNDVASRLVPELKEMADAKTRLGKPGFWEMLASAVLGRISDVPRSEPIGATPLSLTIVWHPSFGGGLVVAESMAERFEPLNASNLISGLRIPVRIRSESESGTPGDPPPAIPLDEADVNLVLLLGTKELMQAAGGAWKAFFDKLVAGMAGRGQRDTLLVAALDKQGLALPQNPNMQAQRTYEWSEEIFIRDGANLKVGPGLVRLAMIVADAFAYRLLFLEEKERKAKEGNSSFTEDDFDPPIQTLYLSHTKYDPTGVGLATRIFDLIQKNPYQLGILLDSQHLRPGVNFLAQLTRAISKGLFLAIVTDKYLERAICRFEVVEAKRNRRPIFVAYQLETGENRTFPYVGNLPARILPKEPSPAEIDMLLLDCCLEYLRSLSFRREARALRDKLVQGGAKVDVLYRKPELSDMREWTSANPPNVVLYPDPPLTNHELELISHLTGGNIAFKALSEA